MKKYTAIIKTRQDCIDNDGNVRSRTFKYEADRLRPIYEAAAADALSYGGLYAAIVYDRQGRAVKEIAVFDGKAVGFGELDWQERQYAAELYEEHKGDDVITL